MENLNDLIWMDEEDSGNNNIQPQEHDPMHETCMIAFCTAGNFPGCTKDRANGIALSCS